MLQNDFADTVDHAEMGQACGRKVLWEGQLGGESGVDGEEGDGYGAGDIAAVGVDLGVEVFKGAGAVCKLI